MQLEFTRHARLVLVAAVLLLTLLVSSLALASDATGGFTFIPLTPDGDPISVAKSAGDGLSTQDADINPNNLEFVSVIVTFEKSVNPNTLAAVTDGEVVHHYKEVFNGASMVVSDDSVATLAALPGVTGVYPDTLQQPDTDSSMQYIGAPALWDALGGQSNAGEGIVIGIIDHGIWPEHPSFSDPDPFGKPYPDPAIRPTRCDFGNDAYNEFDEDFTCNNKIIGAYNMLDGYKARFGLISGEFDSARDDYGHGTLVASTAAGNGGVDASISGLHFGTVSGVAPRAQIIVYRICANRGCTSSDALAAIEQAILDGVDVINYSIGGGIYPDNDPVELAFANAYANGIFVAASAGNDGPTPDTIHHRSPWVTTVAASTNNRTFVSTLTLTDANGITLTIPGVTISGGIPEPTPVVSELSCNTPKPPNTYNGEIVLCPLGTDRGTALAYHVKNGGGAGMILLNPPGQGLAYDNYFLPTFNILNHHGDVIRDFLQTHEGVVASFTPSVATPLPNDVMGSFSSRGGTGLTHGISKPDIAAPGSLILASNTMMTSVPALGPAGEPFRIAYGTSMASPHVAGAAALIAAQHPDWTPGQIKSALMTSARMSMVKEDGVTPATPFDTGSGRLDLARAMLTPITFDETLENYIAYHDHLWDANYPSLYVPNLIGSMTVQRTVEDQTGKKSTWQVTISSPPDVKIYMPKKFTLKPNGQYTFNITVSAPTVPIGEVRHAALRFRSNNGVVLTFPITIVRGRSMVSMSKVCTPNSIRLKEITNCTITLANNSYDDVPFDLLDILPSQLNLISTSVVGGEQVPNVKNRVRVSGVLEGATPPGVTTDLIPLDGDYFPLAPLGIEPIFFPDEGIANFFVPPFHYAGAIYSRIGVTSNGYVIVGGGTPDDVKASNTDLPDPALPNNILAPFWTDLNPEAAPVGGGVRVAIISYAFRHEEWIVIDWNQVPNSSNPSETNTFQIVIGANNIEDISFTLDNVTTGDQGYLTIGAENKHGNSGETVYYNGRGVAPGNSGDSYEVRVASDGPGTPGGTHTLSYSATGRKVGAWTDCAELTSDALSGTAIVCASGQVNRR